MNHTTLPPKTQLIDCDKLQSADAYKMWEISDKRECLDGYWAPIPDREILHREFEPLVRKLIRKYSNSPEMGRDMVSEAYHRFATILEEFDPSRGIPLKGYIVRKLTASMYTYSRSCWSNQIREESLDAYSGFAETISIEDPTDSWIRQIESEMLMRNIQSAMGSISNRQRTALVWRYMNGMSFEDIAARLQVQPATARSRCGMHLTASEPH
jgi:RNA polymerase sigma factor (sigma-70 family)